MLCIGKGRMRLLNAGDIHVALLSASQLGIICRNCMVEDRLHACTLFLIII